MIGGEQDYNWKEAKVITAIDPAVKGEDYSGVYLIMDHKLYTAGLFTKERIFWFLHQDFKI